MLVMVMSSKAQLVTTFTPYDKYVTGDDVKAYVSKVTLYSNYTMIEIALKPYHYISRLNFWTSPYTYLQAGTKRLEYLGVLSKDEKSYHSAIYDDGYGWTGASSNYTYTYTLVFEGCPEDGVESISLVDPGESYHGYCFYNITINNPSNVDDPILDTDNNEYSDDDNSNIDWEKYLAYTTQKVNMRSESNSSSDIVMVLPRNTNLFVDKDEEENGFYKVIDLATNNEGYVSKNYIAFGKKIQRSSGKMFHGQQIGNSYDPPVIHINNATNTSMKLKVGTTEYQFSPYEKKTITILSGTYNFLATAPGVYPLAGTKKFEAGWEYDWGFKVVTHYSSRSANTNKQSTGFKRNNGRRIYKKR